MGYRISDVAKLSVGLMLSAAALKFARFFWKRMSVGDGARSSLTSQPQQQHSPQKAAAAPAAKADAAASAENEQEAEGSDDAAAKGVWIYFGSQSGTAESFSNELQQESKDNGMEATVVDLEDFDPETFQKHKTVILCVATYGEGDPTDNAAEFFRWLKDDASDPTMLSGMQFCVMGLGNRQYINFNSCGKMADERLSQLGATRIYDLGIGDDDQNIEEDFEQWKENGLWPALLKAEGKKDKLRAVSAASGFGQQNSEQVIESLPLRATIEENPKKLPVDPLVQVGGSDVVGKWYFQSNLAPVVTERELRQAPDAMAGRTTKHIDVDVKSIPALDWRTADNLEVLPRNPDEVVEWWAERLGVKGELESFVGFKRSPGVERTIKKPFPTPCTVQDALALYCDLCQAPGKGVLRKMAAFIRNEDRKHEFEQFVENRSAFQWATGEGVRMSFRELFELYFSSADIDIGTFLQICPRQKNRPYTIASSSREDRHTIGICVSVVAEELATLEALVEGLKERGHQAPGAEDCLKRAGDQAKAPRSFRGACSTMLCTRTQVGSKLWIATRPSTFRLPRKVSTPIVMVGAGTGVAPFRGFVREFTAEGGTRKKTTLFFGCQKSTTDFLYKDELTKALKGEPKVLGELVTAFSREQQEKVYVQNQMHQRSKDIAALVNEGAYIFVCGATSMGAAVRAEVAAALGSPDHVNRLQTEGRFVEELW